MQFLVATGFMEFLMSINTRYFDGLVQERRNSIANALEIRLSCTNPSILSKSSTSGISSKVWFMHPPRSPWITCPFICWRYRRWWLFPSRQLQFSPFQFVVLLRWHEPHTSHYPAGCLNLLSTLIKFSGAWHIAASLKTSGSHFSSTYWFWGRFSFVHPNHPLRRLRKERGSDSLCALSKPKNGEKRLLQYHVKVQII